MKKFTLNLTMAFIAICCCASLNAQTVIKVGAGQGDKQKTIQMAYDSIVPATVAEAYVLEIQSDYDPTTEIYPITLKAKTGVSATNNITIKPATGVKKVIGPANKTVVLGGLTFASGDTQITVPSITGIEVGHAVYGAGLPPYIGTVSAPSYSVVSVIDTVNSKITMSSAATGASVADKKTFIGPILTKAFLFDGAKFVTIDGISRTGNTGLTIQNPNSINCQTFMLRNSTENCTIKNCFIRGANVSGSYNNGVQGTVYFQTASNITITQCDVCDMNDPNIPFPITAFQITGEGTNSNNEVSDCNVYNISNYHSTNGNAAVFQFGSAGGQNNKILNNRIFWTKETFIGSINLMGVGGSMNGLGNRFEGNVIGYENAEGTGVAMLKSTNNATLKAIIMRNFTCVNNKIANIEFTGANFTAIELGNSVAQTIDADAICYNNVIENIILNQTTNGTLAGIIVSAAIPYDVTVKNNTIKNLNTITTTAAHTSTVAGINFSGTANAAYKYKFLNNKVSLMSAGSAISTAVNYAYGIRVPFNTTSVEQNLIYDITTVNSDNKGAVRGIQTAGSNAAGLLIANNIVRIGANVTSDAFVAAIMQEAATTAGDPCKIYNNTLYVGGQASGASTKSTYGYFRNTGASQLIDFQNNIVANKRVVKTTESHYSMHINAKAEFTKCDYNMFQFGGNFAYVTSLTAAAPDLAIWQNPDGVGLDTNSTTADPQFENATASVPDMRLKATSPAKAAGTNLLTVVPKDFNGFTRTANDLGALAYGTVSGFNPTKAADLQVYTTRNNIVVNNQMGQTAKIYSLSGQLVKTTVLQSDKESISVNNGFFIVKVNSLVSKVLVK
jgi:hypothetical protein